ncbi:hypothetical protein [Marivita sp.]|jgi:hypothetical protein
MSDNLAAFRKEKKNEPALIRARKLREGYQDFAKNPVEESYVG